MCKNLLDNVMCVTRKNCKSNVSKARIEGIAIGVFIGIAGGIASGIFFDSDKGKQLRSKLLCKCMGVDCDFYGE